MEYIEKDALAELIESFGVEHPSGLIAGDILIQDVLDFIEDSNTIEYSPTPHAKWEFDTEDIYKCTNCGEKTHVDEVMGIPDYDYCPYCGAIMEGVGSA